MCVSNLPASKREISSKSPINSSAAPNALSMCPDIFVFLDLLRLHLMTKQTDEPHSMAALNRDLPQPADVFLIEKPTPHFGLHQPIADLIFLILWFAHGLVIQESHWFLFNAFSACLKTVISVKLITNPPLGIGFP